MAKRHQEANDIIVNQVMSAARHGYKTIHIVCVDTYLLDSGGNVSDLALARNCCLARMLPGEAELVSERKQVCHGRQKV